jgi:hypothetical protein
MALHALPKHTIPVSSRCVWWPALVNGGGCRPDCGRAATRVPGRRSCALPPPSAMSRPPSPTDDLSDTFGDLFPVTAPTRAAPIYADTPRRRRRARPRPSRRSRPTPARRTRRGGRRSACVSSARTRSGVTTCLFPRPARVRPAPDRRARADSWNAARGAAAFLDGAPTLYRGRRVLELGAGAGLPGLVCALNGAAQVRTPRTHARARGADAHRRSC